MKTLRLSLLLFFLTCLSNSLSAQLFIDGSYTIQQMVHDFFDGHCVKSISNVQFHGDSSNSMVFFDAGTTNLNIGAGIFLSSGYCSFMVGPNSSGSAGYDNNYPGDTDLNIVSGGTTYNASIVEFDLVPDTTVIDFKYVFASEEYPEYVCFAYNDAFAFFISGPGITGVENIAKIPGTNLPVSINSVNGGPGYYAVPSLCIDTTNTSLYVDNTGGQYVEYDGFTTPLRASATVIPDSTYHIKIGVADCTDGVFDSGIFLSAESLCNDSLMPMAIFIYNLSNKNNTTQTLTVTNLSRYARYFNWDFGDGTTSTDRNPAPHTYTTGGNYNVTLTVGNYCCTQQRAMPVAIVLDTTTTPIDTTQLPIDTTQLPIDTTQLPIDTTQLPIDTTSHPIDTTEAPVDTANAIHSIENIGLRISPNPFSNTLYLETQLSEAVLVEVYDPLSQVVLQERFTVKTVLNTALLPKGVYLLKLIAKKQVLVRRIIKN